METVRKTRTTLAVLILLVSFVCGFAKHNLLIIRTAGENFEEAKNGLSFELEYDFTISDMIIDKEATPEMIAETVGAENPDVVVLMNNRSVSLYKKYQKSLAEDAKVVPTVSLMGILIDDAIDEIKNSYGIDYEIPIVTSTVNLRTIMGSEKVKNIGIVHRQNMHSFIEENKAYCKQEGINLETIEIGNDKIESDLNKALKTLIKEKKVDVIWVPVDNKIVNKKLLMNVWIPFQKKNKMPIIVGVGTLVNPKFHFGTFAVLPDHVALGSQAASVIYEIMDNNWVVEESGEAQPPLSVYTIVNYPDSKEYFGLDKDDLSGVDKIIE